MENRPTSPAPGEAVAAAETWPAETSPVVKNPVATNPGATNLVGPNPAVAFTGRSGPGETHAGDRVPEIGGPEGPEPTRYGDWERKGRCIDF
jgi:Protein of unknown function (DUF1674)